MKSVFSKRRAAKSDRSGLAQVLPQIQTLIKTSRQYVASTANLTLVWLYWHVGRVIAVDIQQNAKRAGYGQQLLSGLADVLIRQYGSGYSQSNLNDMRRFFEAFEISSEAPDKLFASQILQALPVKFSRNIRQAGPAESSAAEIRQPLAGKSAPANILQALPVESENRPVIDFSKHHRLGWTHYRILLGTSRNSRQSACWPTA